MVRKERLKRYSKTLNKNLPRSEVWFHDNWKPITGEMMNAPLRGYLPDIRNKLLKYVIEVDGSIHNLPEIQAKDKAKDTQFNALGYTVFRIKAYDLNRLNEVRTACLKLFMQWHKTNE